MEGAVKAEITEVPRRDGMLLKCNLIYGQGGRISPNKEKPRNLSQINLFNIG